MGIKERQDRERLAVREAILAAARELFVAEGYRNVSLRKIAERIEYSPAAIYSYFPNKDAIFFALAEEGFRLMYQAGMEVVITDDPLENLRRSFWSYYQFSRHQSQYFELMFLDRSVPQITGDLEQFAFLSELTRAATGTVQACIDAGAFPKALDAAAAFHVLWAAMHGATALALCQRLSPAEDPDRLARDTLEAAIAGLRAGSPITFAADLCFWSAHQLQTTAPAASLASPTGASDHASS